MKFYAVKCISNEVGVRRNPALKDASSSVFYTKGEYFVASQEQLNLLNKEDIEMICDVKKPKPRKAKKADGETDGVRKL